MLTVIRRISKSVGVPIGPYKIVTRRTKTAVYARTIGAKRDYYLSENLDNYGIISSQTCKISSADMKRLQNTWQFRLTLTPKRNKCRMDIANLKPEIIKFWTADGEVMFVQTEKVAIRVIEGIPYVCIDINSKMHDKRCE